MLFIFCQENRNNCLVIKFIIIKVIQFINILLIKPKRYGLELKTSFQMENSLQMTVYITIFIWQCTLGFTCFSYLLRRRHSIYSIKNDGVFLDIRPSVLQLFRPTSMCFYNCNWSNQHICWLDMGNFCSSDFCRSNGHILWRPMDNYCRSDGHNCSLDNFRRSEWALFVDGCTHIS